MQFQYTLTDDVAGAGTTSADVNITFGFPPAPVAATTGPYVANLSATVAANVTLDASPSSCYRPACTYTWSLACPGAATRVYNGSQVRLVIGNNAAADIVASLAGDTVCNVTLLSIDAAGFNNTAATTVTAGCAAVGLPSSACRLKLVFSFCQIAQQSSSIGFARLHAHGAFISITHTHTQLAHSALPTLPGLCRRRPWRQQRGPTLPT